MSLLPQDLFVVLQLAAVCWDEPYTYSALATRLHLSLSRVHDGIRRATAAGLVHPDRDVRRPELLEFLSHGVRYAFYAERGPMTQGIPTAHGAYPLSELITDGGPIPVWPTHLGTARGETLKPLHPSALYAADEQPQFYELLALVDALRIGDERQRKLAMEQLESRMRS